MRGPEGSVEARQVVESGCNEGEEQVLGVVVVLCAGRAELDLAQPLCELLVRLVSSSAKALDEREDLLLCHGGRVGYGRACELNVSSLRSGSEPKSAPCRAFPRLCSSERSVTVSHTVQRKLGLARGYLSGLPQQQHTPSVSRTGAAGGGCGGRAGRRGGGAAEWRLDWPRRGGATRVFMLGGAADPPK